MILVLEIITLKLVPRISLNSQGKTCDRPSFKMLKNSPEISDLTMTNFF